MMKSCLDFEKAENRPDTIMALNQAIRFVQTAQARLGKPPSCMAETICANGFVAPAVRL
jgi:hypothetical protein